MKTAGIMYVYKKPTKISIFEIFILNPATVSKYKI
jgi:hypothetical protein